MLKKTHAPTGAERWINFAITTWTGWTRIANMWIVVQKKFIKKCSKISKTFPTSTTRKSVNFKVSIVPIVNFATRTFANGTHFAVSIVESRVAKIVLQTDALNVLSMLVCARFVPKGQVGTTGRTIVVKRIASSATANIVIVPNVAQNSHPAMTTHLITRWSRFIIV